MTDNENPQVPAPKPAAPKPDGPAPAGPIPPASPAEPEPAPSRMSGIPAHPETPRVVVGVDGSDQSIAALRRGVRFATSLGGELEAVIAWHFPRDGFLYPPMTQWSPERDAETVVRTAADTVFGDSWPDWFKIVVLQGTPAGVLIDHSVGAELLIVGSRGHGGIAGLLLGSVSAVCAAHAHCPVLIMHEKTTE